MEEGSIRGLVSGQLNGEIYMLSPHFMKTETQEYLLQSVLHVFGIRVEPAVFFLTSEDHVVLTLFKRVIVLYFFKTLKGY